MSRVVGTATLVALVLGIALPFAWAVWASLVPEARLFTLDDGAGLSLDNYRALLQSRAFLVPLRNSLLVAAATTGLCVGVGAPAAYALARLPLRGRGALLAAILTVSMFPQISIVAPLYLLLRELHLVDTYPGLVLPYVTFTLPLCVWMLTGFFRQLPREVEEAALVDGASRARVLVDVVVPMAMPGLATTAILTFLACWNEFLFALSFMVSPAHHTLPVAVALWRGQHQVPWGQILAASVTATVPVAVVVLVLQRWIVKGLVAGAVKG